jgi:hypothetical protein
MTLYFTQEEFYERLRDYSTFAERNGLANTMFGISTKTKHKHSIPGWYSIGIDDNGYYEPLFDIYLGGGNNIIVANDYLKSVCKEIGVYHATI